MARQLALCLCLASLLWPASAVRLAEETANPVSASRLDHKSDRKNSSLLSKDDNMNPFSSARSGGSGEPSQESRPFSIMSPDSVDETMIGGIKVAVLYPTKRGGPHHHHFPVVVFIHGAGMKDSSGYSVLFKHLTEAGFVVVANMQDMANGGAKTSVSTKPAEDYVNKIFGGLQGAVHRGNLRESVDTTRMGLMGHSFGGVTSLGWASSPSAAGATQVKAVVTFHGPFALGTTSFLHSDRDGATKITKPVLVVTGSGDTGFPIPGCTPPTMYHTYEQLASREKVFMHVEGAGHAEVFDDKPPTKTGEKQLGEIQAGVLAMRAWVKDDHMAKQTLYGGLDKIVPLVNYETTPSGSTPA